MATLGTLLMLAAMGAMLRRIVLEAGLRPYDPTRHRLYCRQEGTGPPLLLLHGLAGSWRYWRRGLDGLRSRHTLYLPDLLGFGRSPMPRGDYSVLMHVEALTQLIEEVNGTCMVAGHSMGAIIALGLYARYPTRVKRLVLIGLPYYPSRALAKASLSKLSLMNRLTIARSRIAQAMCYMKDVMGLPIFAPLAGMPVDLYRDYWKHTWNSASQSLFNTLLASDVVPVLEKVDRTRITLVHGSADPVAPVEFIRALVGRFPDLTLRELNGGHHLYLTYPRLLNRIIAGEL